MFGCPYCSYAPSLVGPRYVKEAERGSSMSVLFSLGEDDVTPTFLCVGDGTRPLPALCSILSAAIPFVQSFANTASRPASDSLFMLPFPTRMKPAWEATNMACTGTGGVSEDQGQVRKLYGGQLCVLSENADSWVQFRWKSMSCGFRWDERCNDALGLPTSTSA